MAVQMSRVAIFQTAAWRALWIKALMFNRTTLSAIRISLSPNAGTLIATCGGQQGRTQKGAPSRRTGGSRDGADEADDSDVEPSLGSFDHMAPHSNTSRHKYPQ